MINRLFDEGWVWRDSKADMEMIVGQYFSELFSSNFPTQHDMGKVFEEIQLKLDINPARFLDTNFFGEDIRRAIFDMFPTKASRSDSLPAIFFQKYWDPIGPSVVEACLSGLNDDASVDIAKAIINRFRGALRGVISDTQCAFVPGRLISDNTIVGFECLHRLKLRKQKKGSMAIKLDMSKAYDRVEWIFVEGMMRSFGFIEKRISLIMRCVKSVAYSFLINWELCGSIKPSRGVRQGYPLSPFLFLFCAEGLTSLIQQAHKRGVITGFQCSRGGFAVTHLFFTNDSLLFTKANEVNCVAIKTMLEEYERASGQVINFSKSAMCVSPSFWAIVGERLASMMGIKLVDCHENYLGLPCFTLTNKRKLFATIVDRVWAKIKGWGKKLLSVGGKEVILKAVIRASVTLKSRTGPS
ncbi:hypothetical protein Dsin_026693 [Dipteronia sinensis]|uniref:Reverse transcriptase domain-containing protein n=1 Tax=Dipteronia sinensis TaxID=43782 RepID=A0AAD9ZZJ2_9ROSI|nr:hypothetical protein Dsin_026693 [Dipteronia sinensis]